MSKKIEVPFVRSPYNYDREAVSNETGFECEGPSLTQQEFTEDADINVVMKRFGVTGQLPVGVRMPTYGDFTGVNDFQSAMSAVLAARDSFMEMPAEVRARFHNDPQEFLEFCDDDRNRDEARRLGLVRPEAVVEAAAELVGAVSPGAAKVPPKPE